MITSTSSTSKSWTSTNGYPEGYFDPYEAEVEFLKPYPENGPSAWQIQAGTKGKFQITFCCMENKELLLYPIGYHQFHSVPKEFYKIKNYS